MNHEGGGASGNAAENPRAKRIYRSYLKMRSFQIHSERYTTHMTGISKAYHPSFKGRIAILPLKIRIATDKQFNMLFAF
jgi:hypothetical protein